VRTIVTKNAAPAKAAPEAPARKTTKAAAEPAATRRRTGKSDPETTTAPSAPRRSRGTGAGAKAATGRAARTATVQANPNGSGGRTASGGRNRAPAHTAAAVIDRGGAPPVPPGTDWTPEELAEVRGDLERELLGLRSDYRRAIADITTLQQSSNDGAGDDQADAGSKTFEREQELSIANNRRDLMAQMERALERLDAGTYGRCESCAEPIPKARLQAFPGATLCVRCKQREERR
jgi:RNA polymerase-binding protein DksA